jgi:integrase
MPYLSPPTLTQAEQHALLRATAANPRDHTIFSVALGTGLRLGEIVGLNVGDLYFDDGTPRTRVRLRPKITKGGRAGDVFPPDALVAKLARFWIYKQARRERLDPLAPLFCNQGRRRISRRRVQVLFRAWQVATGFSRLYPFHSLRHAAITCVYRAGGAAAVTQQTEISSSRHWVFSSPPDLHLRRTPARSILEAGFSGSKREPG